MDEGKRTVNIWLIAAMHGQTAVRIDRPGRDRTYHKVSYRRLGDLNEIIDRHMENGGEVEIVIHQSSIWIHAYGV